MDMIYWRHPTLPCIKVEEISGGENYKGAVWLDMARQIYCENGKDEYREIGHFQNGAPFLYGSDSRISVTHCPGLFCVATLDRTPDKDLAEYDPTTALGIDAERSDREQVVKLRDRFMNSDELAMVSGDDVEANVIAWTVKEACYKAALTPGLDFREQIIIERMPKVGPAVPVYDPKEFDYDGSGRGFTEDDYGRAVVRLADGSERRFELFTYRSDDFIVTLAYTADSSRFNKAPKK